MRDSQRDVLNFWFVETKPQQWFQKNDEFDHLVYTRFHAVYLMARQGVFDAWKKDADGCLALCVLLDQFPRNMFRGKPDAFATDTLAKQVAIYAVDKGFDQVLSPHKRRFVYLPFEHSEILHDQMRAVDLFLSMIDDDPLGYEYALRHMAVIQRFGRFPHRNAILGRKNTPDEDVYLAQIEAGF